MKAMLEIEVPRECRLCPCRREYILDGKLHCQVLADRILKFNSSTIIAKGKRKDNCPLKIIP